MSFDSRLVDSLVSRKTRKIPWSENVVGTGGGGNTQA